MESEEFISRIKEYKKEMFLLAVSIVKNYHDAEDAVAETMLRAYEKIHTLDDKEYFKFWIMQILVNNARMILRKNKRVVCTEIYARKFRMYIGCMGNCSGFRR